MHMAVSLAAFLLNRNELVTCVAWQRTLSKGSNLWGGIECCQQAAA
jgi:hypothetical protein